jgi:hypothetical protein
VILRSFPRLLILPLLLTVLTLPFATNRAFADPRDFTLNNGTATTTFNAVYVSPSAAADWEDNLLSSNLQPGQSLNVTFGRFNPSTCTNDVMVSGTDGSSGELDGIDLCSTATVTFR